MTVAGLLVLVSLVWLIVCVTGVIAARASVWSLIATVCAAVIVGAWITGHIVQVVIR